jgi:SAM-dependent methyltransferase
MSGDEGARGVEDTSKGVSRDRDLRIVPRHEPEERRAIARRSAIGDGHEGEAWESRYRNGQTGWDRRAPNPALRHWLGSTIAPGRILVPGCGHGHEVVELIRVGFQVTAVDVAPTPVRRLTALLDREGLEAEVIRADLLAWDPARRFDAVYEQTCLCALHPSTWEEYARRLAVWLRPGGTLFALFMQTGRPGGPPYHCDPTVMRTLFPEPEWQWTVAAPLRVAHPAGMVELGWRLRRGPSVNR